MKPVLQTKLFSLDAPHSGNCLAACHASLLEIPLWVVPAWDEMFGRDDFTGRIIHWFDKFWNLDYMWEQGHPVDTLPEFYIAHGKSPRGVSHAVIYSDGKLVHDPHYSGEGIEEVEGVYYTQPIADRFQNAKLERAPTDILNMVTPLLKKYDFSPKARVIDFMFDLNNELQSWKRTPFPESN